MDVGLETGLKPRQDHEVVTQEAALLQLGYCAMSSACLQRSIVQEKDPLFAGLAALSPHAVTSICATTTASMTAALI